MAGNIYVPLPEDTEEERKVIPPRSNFERPQPWIGRIEHAVKNTPSMRQASIMKMAAKNWNKGKMTGG